MVKMLEKTKARLARTWIGALYEYHHRLQESRQWIRNGRKGSPPHLIKQKIVRQYARQFNCNVLIETGTYLGDMVHAMRRVFREIHSIELSRKLFEQAQGRFAADPHIQLHNGNSGDILKALLPKLHEPCLFWLDAHYSAGITVKGNTDTPIEEELEHIFVHEFADRHVILIDDARTFDGRKDYPTIQTVEARALKAGYHSFNVADDIIRICNPK
jgi:hypothetical protein